MNTSSTCQAVCPQVKSPKDLDEFKLQSVDGDYNESQSGTVQTSRNVTQQHNLK
jgi:hypothetical protein